MHIYPTPGNPPNLGIKLIYLALVSGFFTTSTSSEIPCTEEPGEP